MSDGHVKTEHAPAPPRPSEGSTRAKISYQPTEGLSYDPADPKYWDELVPRMRKGGLLVIDNVLRHGRVLNPETVDDRVIVDFNILVRDGPRVDSILLPVADGITVARVR